MATDEAIPLAPRDQIHVASPNVAIEHELQPTVRDAVSAIPPRDATSVAERWNDPEHNIWRVVSCFFAFIVYGMNDGTPGAMVPHLESHYSLPYSVVSLIFLGPLVGSTIAAFTANRLHAMYGRRGVSALAMGSFTASYLGMPVQPPFGFVVPLLVLAGYGSGLINGSWNSWMGGLVNSGNLLALLHGFWGTGATITHPIVSAMVSRGWGWWSYYYIMTPLSAVAGIFTTYAFWADSGATSGLSRNQPIGFTLLALGDKTTLLFSLFMIVYVGSEVMIGGWLFTSMTTVRHGTSSASSLVASSFWIGITVSRFTLGWITTYVGERVMVSAYIIFAMILQSVFWLGGQFVVSAVMAALIGYAIGMIMPASVRMMSKMVPPEKHLTSVGFGTAFSVSASSIFPLSVGALAQFRGVEVLQPMVLGMFGIQLLLWLVLAQMEVRPESYLL